MKGIRAKSPELIAADLDAAAEDDDGVPPGDGADDRPCPGGVARTCPTGDGAGDVRLGREVVEGYVRGPGRRGATGRRPSCSSSSSAPPPSPPPSSLTSATAPTAAILVGIARAAGREDRPGAPPVGRNFFLVPAIRLTVPTTKQ